MQEIVRLICNIIKWHKKIFPNTSEFEQFCKSLEEIKELIQAVYEKKGTDLEYADVIIACINALRYKHIRELVEYKMAINRKRTFINNHHVEE